MTTETLICLAIGLLILIIIFLLVQLYSVKVYRFYRPGCVYCKESQSAWDSFKQACLFKMIKPIDINMDTANTDDKQLANNFDVQSVPTVIAVYPSGFRVSHNGDRTADNYKKWVN
jgi:glutaredoxin